MIDNRLGRFRSDWVQVNVRLSPDDLKTLKDAAASEGRTISSLIRWMIRGLKS